MAPDLTPAPSPSPPSPTPCTTRAALDRVLGLLIRDALVLPEVLVREAKELVGLGVSLCVGQDLAEHHARAGAGAGRRAEPRVADREGAAQRALHLGELAELLVVAA